MSSRSLAVCVGVACLLITASVVGQDAPAAPTTFWSFLGIPQGLNKIHAQIFNRRGNFPGMEKKPPLKTIADPANLKSDVKAIKAAAEIKQAEDLKPQKIKAIKFLAKIGCGCYDKDGKVTKALIASMEDCTEEVRLAAVNAVAEAAEGEQCENCKQKSCCNKDIVEQLSKIAYEMNENGCYLEPSERVREAAKVALCICCPGQGPIPPGEPRPAIEAGEPPKPIEGSTEQPKPAEGSTEERKPTEAPSGERSSAPAPKEDSAPAPPSQSGAQLVPTPAHGAKPAELAQANARPLANTRLASSRRTFQQSAEETDSAGVAAHMQDGAPAPVAETVRGTVANVDLATGRIELHLHNSKTLPVGVPVQVIHQYLAGPTLTAVLEVVESRPGMALARPISHSKTVRVAKGDETIGWR